jgi:hypothetical protein
MAHPARSAYGRFLAFSARTGADREGRRRVRNRSYRLGFDLEPGRVKPGREGATSRRMSFARNLGSRFRCSSEARLYREVVAQAQNIK